MQVIVRPLSVLAVSALALVASSAFARPDPGATFTALHGAPARPAAEAAAQRWSGDLRQGATPRPEGTRFVLRSENATRVELELFGHFDQVIEDDRANRLGVPARVLTPTRQGDMWVADVEGVGPGEVYGYRVWGPNWPHDPAWVPGSEAGFVEDVDAQGNRFNPNKLLIDPFTRAITRDPDWTGHTHASGPKNRAKDSAPFAGKNIVVDDRFDWGPASPRRRRMADTVVYEVHVKGLTKRFPGVADPGTYKAVADDRVIAYLKGLGVTAIELLPIHEAPNDVNDVDPTDTQGKNYWGYMTLAYFAPDRRYSSDQSFDGPVREFKAMVRKLHENGIEVLLDVVFNHTAEGGAWRGEGIDERTSTIFSWRGVDNQLYYELAGGNRSFYDNTGIGANLRTAYPKVQEYILESLRYFTETMKVDGFRFDLCSVLGNSRDRDGFAFQRNGGLLERIARAYGYTAPGTNPAGVKLIAEPWAIWDDTYQLGNFPAGWSEWNGKFRDTLREFLKGKAGAGAMAEKFNGSYGLFGDDGRRPYNSVNFLAAHDGLTLFDLVSYNVNSEAERDALNNRAWPYGPSDGGEGHNHSWNSAVPGATQEETGALRRQQARNAWTLLFLANGTPMILGGDERLRTKHGNNNTYNLDNEVTWLDWSKADRVNHLDGVRTTSDQLDGFAAFARQLVRFRRAHPAFHKDGWWAPDQDRDGDGHPGVAFRSASGGPLDAGAKHFGVRIDAGRAELDMSEAQYQQYPARDRDLFVIANPSHEGVTYQLPAPSAGKRWYRMVDTHAWAEPEGNLWPEARQVVVEGDYGVHPRSVVVLVER